MRSRNRRSALPHAADAKHIAPGETNTWFIRIHGTELSVEFHHQVPEDTSHLTFHAGKPRESWEVLDLATRRLMPPITVASSSSASRTASSRCTRRSAAAHGHDRMRRQPLVPAQETHMHHRVLTATLTYDRSRPDSRYRVIS